MSSLMAFYTLPSLFTLLPFVFFFILPVLDIFIINYYNSDYNYSFLANKIDNTS